MANMSYCRFENTCMDVEDCLEALREKGVERYIEEANEYEKPNVTRFIELCKEVVDEFGEEI